VEKDLGGGVFDLIAGAEMDISLNIGSKDAAFDKILRPEAQDS
jgi:hypothetical protein